MRFLLNFLLVLLLLAVATSAQQSVPDYRSPSLPIEQRVADLLQRMTLTEKVDQIACGQRRNFDKNDPAAARILDGFKQMYSMDSHLSAH